MNELKKNRFCHLIGEVDGKKIKELADALIDFAKADKTQEVELYISSVGGRVQPAYTFYDFLYLLDMNLVTYAVGEINSIVLPIFLAGKRRVASVHAKFSFNEFDSSINRDGKFSLSELRKEMERLSSLELEYARIVAERSGVLSEDDVLRFMRQEKVLSAQEAKEFGLVHNIFKES